MNQIHQQSIFHANVNVNLMEQNVIQINGRIMMNVDVILKSIMYVKKIIFGKYLASIMDDSVITCDEGIE